ncbi:MAG: S8 family serine peptidase [Acidimicrobiales bacterium]
MAVALAAASLAPAAGAAAATPPASAPAARPVLSAGALRLLADTPGGASVTVVVELADQPVLPDGRGRTRGQRQREVVQSLRSHTDRTQAPLRTQLLRRRAQGTVDAIEPLWISNSLVVTARPSVIEWLSTRPEVAAITPNAIDIVPTAISAPAGLSTPAAAGAAPTAPAEPNVAAIGAPAVWADGATGQGVVVASLDSGVDVTHPDLASRWKGGAGAWFDPYGQKAAPGDTTGHGTQTMGVILGGGTGGTTVGVAPDAHFIAARVFDNAGNATVAAIHQAFQWALNPDGDTTTADAPAVVNNSWAFGSTGCNLEFQPDVQALRAAGIVPVFAGGNFGSSAGSSVSPANYPEALAVGAVDNAGSIYASSSRGPSACGEAPATYPELVAPGTRIWTTDLNGLWSERDGTSLSAPAVTGALALLLSTSAAPTPGEAEAALLASTVDLGPAGPDNTFGLGRIDVAAAAASLASPGTTTTTEPATTTTSTTAPETTTTTGVTSTTVPSGTTTTTEAATATSTTLAPTTTTTAAPTTTSTTLAPTTTTTAAPTTTSMTLAPTTTTTAAPTTTSTTLAPTTTTTAAPTTTSTTAAPTTTTTTAPSPADLVFGDGFESGGFAAWTSAASNGGRLSVTSAAALDGTRGLQAVISNRSDAYVSDVTPANLAAYHARFRFDPNGVTIPSGKHHQVFTARNASGTTILTVELRRSTGGRYEVRAGSRLNSGSTAWTAWASFSDDRHTIEVGFAAGSTASRSDGSVSLWLDGASAASATRLRNGSQRIDAVRLGPQGIPRGVGGTEYFDGFVSTVSSTIGV